MKEVKSLKIAISSSGDNLDSMLDPRFGRCQYFVYVDLESMKFEALPNESLNAMGGAGIQAAQNVANKQVEVVLTGNIGPNAFQTLEAAGVKVFTGLTGTIKEVVEKYKSGELKETSQPNVGSHSGMGAGMGMGSGGGGGAGGGASGGAGEGASGAGIGPDGGAGRGAGRGRGQGRGQGQGRGLGRSQGQGQRQGKGQGRGSGAGIGRGIRRLDE
jgi:predicted Fe-Mo cluster-binding NifX family protein